MAIAPNKLRSPLIYTMEKTKTEKLIDYLKRQPTYYVRNAMSQMIQGASGLVSESGLTFTSYEGVDKGMILLELVKHLYSDRPCPCGQMTIVDCAGECGYSPTSTPPDFVELVKEMRQLQKAYFRTRDREFMIRSKVVEQAVDRAIAQHDTDAQQMELF